MSATHELRTVSECRQDEHVTLIASTSLNHNTTTWVGSTAGTLVHSNIEHVATSTAELNEQSYCGFTDRNTDSLHTPYKLLEHVRNYNEAMYDEPDDSDNDSAETGYLQPMDRGSDLVEAEYLAPVNTTADETGDSTANATYCEPDDFDNNFAKSTYLEPIDGNNKPAKTAHSELLTLAETEYSEPTNLAEADYAELTACTEASCFEIVNRGDNSAQAAQHPITDSVEHYDDFDVAADDDSANSAYGGQAQVASDNSANSTHDSIGNQVKLLMCNS
jgi:hypothetical protein